MAYTLEQLAADCRAALMQDPGPTGRARVAEFVGKAALDPDFVERHVPLDQQKERELLYEDPDLGFCILAHVYHSAKDSGPHDHGPSWAIYGQASGTTDMTDWRVLRPAAGDTPGLAARVRDYALTPGMAYVYNEGELHSPSRKGPTRLIRIEGVNLAGMPRQRFEIAAE